LKPNDTPPFYFLDYCEAFIATLYQMGFRGVVVLEVDVRDWPLATAPIEGARNLDGFIVSRKTLVLKVVKSGVPRIDVYVPTVEAKAMQKKSWQVWAFWSSMIFGLAIYLLSWFQTNLEGFGIKGTAATVIVFLISQLLNWLNSHRTLMADPVKLGLAAGAAAAKSGSVATLNK